jgi:hypothetical protein
MQSYIHQESLLRNFGKCSNDIPFELSATEQLVRRTALLFDIHSPYPYKIFTMNTNDIPLKNIDSSEHP